MNYGKGFKDGLPIGLGYLSVSFSFGILAVSYGLYWWQAAIISFANLTSAGQVAGIGIMASLGGPLEMALTTAVINLRYGLMSISLSQKASADMKTPDRLLTANLITDEVFGVASSASEPVTRNYMLGLGTLPVIGWTLGTILGAICGNILPEIVTEALSIGIYGMFVAIVLPVAKKNKAVLIVSLISILLSVIFYYTPFLHENVSSGFALIICAVFASTIGAVFIPKEPEKTETANG